MSITVATTNHANQKRELREKHQRIERALRQKRRNEQREKQEKSGKQLKIAYMREVREKQQNIQRSLRQKRRDEQREKQEQYETEFETEALLLPRKKGNREQYYDCLEKMFVDNKKRCLSLYKMMIWFIYIISQIFLALSNIVDVVIDTVCKYYFSSILLTTLVYLYVYPEDLAHAIDTTIYIIDTGICKVYIEHVRTFLHNVSNSIV